MRIVPKDARLEVEAVLLNEDISFAGQPAESELETFPFTGYGRLEG